MGPNMVPQVSVLGNEVSQNGGFVMESLPWMPLIQVQELVFCAETCRGWWILWSIMPCFPEGTLPETNIKTPLKFSRFNFFFWEATCNFGLKIQGRRYDVAKPFRECMTDILAMRSVATARLAADTTKPWEVCRPSRTLVGTCCISGGWPSDELTRGL